MGRYFVIAQEWVDILAPPTIGLIFFQNFSLWIGSIFCTEDQNKNKTTKNKLCKKVLEKAAPSLLLSLALWRPVSLVSKWLELPLDGSRELVCTKLQIFKFFFFLYFLFLFCLLFFQSTIFFFAFFSSHLTTTTRQARLINTTTLL